VLFRSLSYSRGDQKFAELFPGMMKQIVSALQNKADEIKQNSTSIVPGGYDIQAAIADIKLRLPVSYASEAPEPEVADEPVDQAGTYLITHVPTGKIARIPADSRDDAQRQLLARHPDINLDDFTIELAAE
jgi:hypothetical protein